MAIEYEAMFIDIDPTAVREALQRVGATLEKPETLYTRYAFDLPGSDDFHHEWARVRDEGDVITMSWKGLFGEGIDRQKEIELVVDNMQKAVQFLEVIGCEIKSYQETRREVWMLDGVEVVIDWWPFLEPVVEIEGSDESAVRAVAERLGFEYAAARFESIDYIYAEKYNTTSAAVCQLPRIVFEDSNPFIQDQASQ